MANERRDRALLLRLTATEKQALEEAARKRWVTESQLLREALAEWIQNHLTNANARSHTS